MVFESMVARSLRTDVLDQTFGVLDTERPAHSFDRDRDLSLCHGRDRSLCHRATLSASVSASRPSSVVSVGRFCFSSVGGGRGGRVARRAGRMSALCCPCCGLDLVGRQ